jgi:hypothetical protein
MLLQLMAVQMHKTVLSGRNKPVIFGCVDDRGNLAGDYVVKLSGAMDTRVRGPGSELIASCLAGHFGLQRPQPAAVQLHPELVKWLAAQRADLAPIIRASTSLNFATKFLTDVATWPVGRALPEAMLTAAAHVFAFDALIANDDRRRNNPNVLVRGDEIFVIDHESAFAFLYLVNSRAAPWEIRQRASLREHVFFYQLRKTPIDLTKFTARLSGIGDVELDWIIQQMPNEWRHDDLGRISTHLKAVRDHAADFERQILEILV